jgi:hypothetical protein
MTWVTGVVIYSLFCHSEIHSLTAAKEAMNAPHSSLSFSRLYLGKKNSWRSQTHTTAGIHFKIITKLKTPGALSFPSSFHLHSKFEL